MCYVLGGYTKSSWVELELSHRTVDEELASQENKKQILGWNLKWRKKAKWIPRCWKVQVSWCWFSEELISEKFVFLFIYSLSNRYVFAYHVCICAGLYIWHLLMVCSDCRTRVYEKSRAIRCHRLNSTLQCAASDNVLDVHHSRASTGL